MSGKSFDEEKVEMIMDKWMEKNRPPVEVRDQVDIAYRIKGQSVEIFEIRTSLFNPMNKIENAIAKTTFVKTQNIWKIFWQRSDLKWHTYDPYPEAKSLEEFLRVVEEDENACFRG